MKANLLLSIVAIAALVSGCAGTGGSKSDSKAEATAKSKALTAQDVVARFAKLTYGGDGARKHPSTTMKGMLSVEQFGVDGPFVSYARTPDSSANKFELMGMSLGNGCFKGTCWNQQPGAGTAILSGDAAALQMQQSDYTQWAHLDRYYTTLEIVEPEGGAESPRHKIKAVKKNGDTDYYEFSKDTGLLEAGVIDGETPQGRMKVGMQFNNYKSFDGMLMPTELIQVAPQATVKLTINEVTFEPIADDKFAKPD